MARRYVLGGVPVADDDWLRPGEAAVLLGTGAHWLADLARNGTIPADAVWRTPGGQRRYRAGAIIALLEETGRS